MSEFDIEAYLEEQVDKKADNDDRRYFIHL
jgi:hypothetical protein